MQSRSAPTRSLPRRHHGAAQRLCGSAAPSHGPPECQGADRSSRRRDPPHSEAARESGPPRATYCEQCPRVVLRPPRIRSGFFCVRPPPRRRTPRGAAQHADAVAQCACGKQPPRAMSEAQEETWASNEGALTRPLVAGHRRRKSSSNSKRQGARRRRRSPEEKNRPPFDASRVSASRLHPRPLLGHAPCRSPRRVTALTSLRVFAPSGWFQAKGRRERAPLIGRDSRVSANVRSAPMQQDLRRARTQLVLRTPTLDSQTHEKSKVPEAPVVQPLLAEASTLGASIKA